MNKTKLILRKIKRVANKSFGTKVDEFFWKFRHFVDKNWAESYVSKESINHPHRKVLVDIISKYFPFEKVLEIGCASGPNLYLLAKKFPKVKFYGIDISKKAITTGRDFFKKENITNTFLEVGKFEKLKKISNKSIDLIFTDAVLIYEGPEKINSIIKEMSRVAKKAIILCEQNNNLRSSFYKDHWVYDYKFLFSKFLSSEKIKTTKISSSTWDGEWGKMGYIIEIHL